MVPADVRMLLVIVLDMRCAVVGEVTGGDVELAVEVWAEFPEFVEDEQGRRSRILRLGEDIGETFEREKNPSNRLKRRINSRYVLSFRSIS